MDPVRLQGTLTPKETLVGYFTIPDKVDIDYYDGVYDVTPLVHNEVILETSGKAMRSNVTVMKIPSWITSNESGKTFIIGE